MNEETEELRTDLNELDHKKAKAAEEASKKLGRTVLPGDGLFAPLWTPIIPSDFKGIGPDWNPEEGSGKMLSRYEVRILRNELQDLTQHISEGGKIEVIGKESYEYVCAVVDALNCVVGHVKLETFRSKSFLNLEAMKKNLKDDMREARR